MRSYKTRKEVLYAMYNDKDFDLMNARSRLINNKSTVMRAAKIDMDSFREASERLQNDKAFTLDILRINNWDACYANNKLEDYEDVRKFVRKLGCHRKFGNYKLQTDTDIVMAFVCRCTHMLSIARKELTSDIYIYMRSYMIFSIDLKKMNVELCNDKELVVQCVGIWYGLIQFMGFKLKTNPKMVALALIKKPEADACVAFRPDIKLSYYSISDNIIWMRLA